MEARRSANNNKVSALHQSPRLWVLETKMAAYEGSEVFCFLFLVDSYSWFTVGVSGLEGETSVPRI